MSSLQKFHRRTLVAAGGVKVIGSEAPVAGSGFYLGVAGDGTSYMYVAPASTESQRPWGSYGTARGTISTTDGLFNSIYLYNLGFASHAAAYVAVALTTGGYNTWYLPAKDELNTCWSNHLATPFATSNAFADTVYWSSTEIDGDEWAAKYNAYGQDFSTGTQDVFSKYTGFSRKVRAVRRSTV